MAVVVNGPPYAQEPGPLDTLTRFLSLNPKGRADTLFISFVGCRVAKYPRIITHAELAECHKLQQICFDLHGLRKLERSKQTQLPMLNLVANSFTYGMI